MNNSTPSNFGRERVEYFVKTLSDYRMLLIVPTVACTVLALGYAVFKSNTWTARQSLVIRDDLVGKSFKPGRFESLESLKSAQETILEIARKPQVISNALKNLGPPSMMFTGRSSWPSEKVIEDVQGTISIGAPNGAEFGKTEVILLSTKANSRERARQFIELLLTEIDQKLREVRSAKIQSMSEELAQAVETARVSFEQSAQRLQEMDAKFGADLSTLRSLNLPNSSDGSLQKTIIEIRAEQRRQATEVDLAKKQQEMLIKSYQDPAQYLVTSSDLLKMQPRLEQLVAGLSAAQLELAKVSGKYTEEHTEVKSAKRSILDIKIQILKEIQASIHALGANIEFGEDRIRKLVEAEHELEERLSELSSARVEYDKLEQEVAKKSEVLGQARQDLVQVQSVGQTTIDLLTRVGEPQVSTRPDGPGKRTIVGAGILGGLLIGLGLIMFTAPPYEEDDESETESLDEQPESDSERSPADNEVPFSADASSPEPQHAALTSVAEGDSLETSLPAFIQPPAGQHPTIQTAAAELEAERPEVILQPRNILEELNAQAQSALASKQHSQSVKQVPDLGFEDRRVIPTRRKTTTNLVADSEFAAAISKVSAEVERSHPNEKPRPVARVKSITDLFNPSLSNQGQPGEPGSVAPPGSGQDRHAANQPMAEMEIVDDQSTFIKIVSTQAEIPEVAFRQQEKTPQLERGKLPRANDLSQSSQRQTHQPAAKRPITSEPRDEQKLKIKSKVRPIDLTKVSQALSQRKPDHPPVAAAPGHNPDAVQRQHPRDSHATIDLKGPKPGSPGTTAESGQLLSDSAGTRHTDHSAVGSTRQDAVTEQVFTKQVVTSLEAPDLTAAQKKSSPMPVNFRASEPESVAVNESAVSPAKDDSSEAAAGREDVLQWGDEISEALSAAEIVQQLRARQQQTAADAATDAIKQAQLRPASHEESSKSDRANVVWSSNEQADDANRLEIRRRGKATDEDSRPITGASPVNEQIKNLNDAIAQFCDPLKRKNQGDRNDA